MPTPNGARASRPRENRSAGLDANRAALAQPHHAMREYLGLEPIVTHAN
jgi:hypothetical protein